MRPRAWVARFACACLAALAAWSLAAPPVHDGPAAAGAREATRIAVDVVVYGSEPEAIAAAVAAAEEGAETMLVTPDDRVGGLFVLGELNVLDLKTQPHDYQLGLFDRWWRLVGRGESFDVPDAEKAFERLLEGAGVRVVRSARAVEPVVAAPGVVTGLAFVAGDERAFEVGAGQVIDGSGDADLAAAAGAPFDVGWSAYGVGQRMADTLVLRVAGVDWRELVAGVRARGRDYAVAKDRVVWGPFGGVPAAYQPSRADLRLRGLNVGLQEDGTVLINALLLYGIDPLDPASREEGRRRGLDEGPRIVAYLADHVPGFEGAVFAGGAERLYVRESRHLRARCTLTADDVLDNRVTAQDVAAGGYPLDAQSMTPHDTGFVWGVPEMYGGRLCMMVPSGGPSGLWVVGRSAGYDPVAFASARVVPFGMAMAEAAGVAAALAAREGLSPQTASRDPATVAAVRERLAARGAYLPDVRPRRAAGPVDHPHYEAFRTLVARGLATGGYANDPGLATPVTTLSFAYLLANVATRFHLRPDLGQAIVDAALARAAPDAPLTPEVAAAVTKAAACLLEFCPPDDGWEALHGSGLAWRADPPPGPLDRGQAYALAAALARVTPLAEAPPR
ncbi:MAG TPA: FAD-dependent oxidoreductase [Trueperaceae bacterium]